jgi:hypothetical protein
MRLFEIPNEINLAKVQSLLPNDTEVVNYDEKDPNETWVQVRHDQLDAVLKKGIKVYMVRYPHNDVTYIGLRIRVNFDKLINSL